jgi:hypothetical protein
MRLAVIKWVSCQQYTMDNFPKPSMKYNCPSIATKSYPSCSSEETSSDDDPEKFTMPRRVLLKIIGDRDHDTLPAEIRRFLARSDVPDPRSRRQRFIDDVITLPRHPSLKIIERATSIATKRGVATDSRAGRSEERLTKPIKSQL